MNLPHPLRRQIALALLAVACAGVARAQPMDLTLQVGSDAPALSVGKWVKGEPVAAIEAGKVHVVEFWATWCGPCKASIPHLSALAKKYPDVVVIGQNVMEQDPSAVGPFVTQMGESMAYRVATDDGGGTMAKTWMEAAGQNGIPCAFIVDKDRKVAWIGHPMTMDEPLAKVVAGTWDLEAARKQAADDAKKQAAMQQVSRDFQTKVGPLLERDDHAGAAAAIDELIAKYPDVRRDLQGAKFGVLLQGKSYDKAYEVADAMAADANGDASVQVLLARLILDGPGIERRDLDRAAKYAARAVELTESKDADALQTLARAHADKGETAKAVELQAKAVALATDEDEKAAMQKTLEKYQGKSE